MKKELLELKDRIVVVSKNRSLEDIRRVYEQGFRIFGENRVQELVSRQNSDMTDIHWHLVGHLQGNKVRKAVSICELIHSVDSEKLLAEIDREAGRQGKKQDVLLQVNVAMEETKFGFTEEEVRELIGRVRLENTVIRGIMVIGPHTDDENRIREVFAEGKQLFEELKQHNSDCVCIECLSMGMSQDYRLALECGSTLLRLGRIMFDAL